MSEQETVPDDWTDESAWFTEADREEMYYAHNKPERLRRIRAIARLALRIGDELAARNAEENITPRLYLDALLSGDARRTRSAATRLSKIEHNLEREPFKQYAHAVGLIHRQHRRVNTPGGGAFVDFWVCVENLAMATGDSFAECLRVEKMYQTLLRQEAS